MASLLILTPQIPYPPRQGTALRNWGILRALAQCHKVSLLSFSAADQPTAPDPVLEALLERFAAVPQPLRSVRDRLRDLATDRRPDLALRLVSPAFEAILHDWLADYSFDWVLVEGLELATYMQHLRPPTRLLFDDHNCEYLLQKRAAETDWRRPSRWAGAAYSSVQWRRLRRYEREACRRSDLVVAVSADDARALRNLAPDLEPLVIPNGIAVSEYADFAERADLQQPSFIFTGTMDFRPNVDGVLWFADKVWPQVRAALPQAHFYVVGRRPHPRLERLSSVPGIVITGAVPDTRPYIRAAAVYVVPLLVGGGTRLKLLESTAMGKPVVSTTLGAEGFADAGQAMILADTPADFARACIELAGDINAQQAWATRASRFAQAYAWEQLIPPLLARLA